MGTPPLASRLAETHIELQARLRALIGRAVGQAWDGLGSYDRADIDRWLAQAVPLVTTGQRQSVALTNAYIARSLERRPLGIDMAALIGPGVRNGAPPEEVYTRPFVNVWTALGNGGQWTDAVAAGRARAVSTAAMDMQLSMRGAANAVQEADATIIGYERVADGGACAFCQEVDTAFVKSADAMALHNNCGCGLEPVTFESRGQRTGLQGQHGRQNVAIHEHGELGPVLTDPTQNFTTAAEALS